MLIKANHVVQACSLAAALLQLHVRVIQFQQPVGERESSFFSSSLMMTAPEKKIKKEKLKFFFVFTARSESGGTAVLT